MIIRKDVSKQGYLSHTQKYRKRQLAIGTKQMSFSMEIDAGEILERMKRQMGVSYSDFINKLVREYHKIDVSKQKALPLAQKYRKKSNTTRIKQMSFMLDKDVRDIFKRMKEQIGVSHSSYASKLIMMYHQEIYKPNK